MFSKSHFDHDGKKGKIGFVLRDCGQLGFSNSPIRITSYHYCLNVNGNFIPIRIYTIELIFIFAGIILLIIVTQSGRGNWFHDIILVGLFIAVAIGFYFIK